MRRFIFVDQVWSARAGQVLMVVDNSIEIGAVKGRRNCSANLYVELYFWQSILRGR